MEDASQVSEEFARALANAIQEGTSIRQYQGRINWDDAYQEGRVKADNPTQPQANETRFNVQVDESQLEVSVRLAKA